MKPDTEARRANKPSQPADRHQGTNRFSGLSS
jgi:hypothetical protein